MDEFYQELMIEAFDNIASDETYEKRATEIITLIKSHNPKAHNLLELACGTGNFTKQLAKQKFIITATDISKDEIAKAKTKKIRAKFSVGDMSKLNAKERYDVVCCFWESFRYLPNHKVCIDTLKRISNSLKKKGLFFVDFTDFPPHNTPFKIPTYNINIGKGLQIQKDTFILTKGNKDTRWDEIRYKLNEKDVTGQKIEWNGKKVYLKPKLSRAPLLRISEEQMKYMLVKAGFEVLEIRHGFAGCYESMLFVVKKLER